MVARTLLVLAQQMQQVALAWLVYDRTGRALDLGLLGLWQFVPVASLTLISGSVIDRFDRRRLAMACLAANAVVSLGLAASNRYLPDQVWLLFGFTALAGAVQAFIGPLSQTMVGDLVAPERLSSAFASSTLLRNLAIVIGPLIGGGILAGCHDPAVVFQAAAVVFLVSLAAVGRLSARPVVRRAASGQVLDGFRYLVRDRLLLGAISLDLVSVLLGGATAMLPIFAKDVLHVGPLGLGFLRSAPSVGAGLTAAYLRRRPVVSAIGPKLLVAVAAFGFATVGFALSHDLVLSIALLACAGGADVVNVVIRLVLVQHRAPPAMRGRVSAINSLFIVTSNELGEMESGLTAAWLGAVPAVLLGGIAAILVAASWSIIFPQLRRTDRLD